MRGVFAVGFGVIACIQIIFAIAEVSGNVMKVNERVRGILMRVFRRLRKFFYLLDVAYLLAVLFVFFLHGRAHSHFGKHFTKHNRSHESGSERHLWHELVYGAAVYGDHRRDGSVEHHRGDGGCVLYRDGDCFRV